jgi:Glycosyl hydrolases family 16/CARDB
LGSRVAEVRGHLNREMSAAIAALICVLLLVVGVASGAPRGRKPDLRVRALSNPPASVERGGRLTSALRVANVGTRTARRSTVRGFLSRDSRKSRGDIALQPARWVPRIKPGKTMRRTMIARVPRATSTGLWFHIACADAARIVRETNETNNCRASARRTAVTPVGSPPSSPPPPPPPIAGQGYTVRFEDNFETFNGGSWGRGIWYDPGSPANSIYTEDGVLHLVSRRSQGYQNITVSTEAGTTRKVFQYGYMEARMSWTRGNGAWPAFWLLSYRHAVNPAWPSINPYCAQNRLPASDCWSGEIDVFEGQGSEPSTFYHTIHKNSSGGYGVANEQNINNSTSGFNLAGFHKYAILWTASEMKWYLDDNLIHTERASDSALNGRIFAGLRQPMFVLFDMFIGGWTTGTDASTPNELKTEVDWVRVWQK